MIRMQLFFTLKSSKLGEALSSPGCNGGAISYSAKAHACAEALLAGLFVLQWKHLWPRATAQGPQLAKDPWSSDAPWWPAFHCGLAQHGL